jgi:hypothetical protein
MIPLGIIVEVGMSIYEVYLGNKSTGWEGAFSGSANVVKSAITGTIYVIYTALCVKYGWLLTAALRKSSTVNGKNNRSSIINRNSQGRPSRDTLGSNSGRESAGVGGGAQKLMRRYFIFGGLGTAIGSAYKARNCARYWGKTIYELPPCQAYYFDAVSVIFLVCQLFWVVSQSSSYIAMTSSMEKKRKSRGNLIDLRGGGGENRFYRPEATPLLEDIGGEDGEITTDDNNGVDVGDLGVKKRTISHEDGELTTDLV